MQRSGVCESVCGRRACGSNFTVHVGIIPKKILQFIFVNDVILTCTSNQIGLHGRFKQERLKKRTNKPKKTALRLDLLFTEGLSLTGHQQ